MAKWQLVPIIKPLDVRSVYEHTPLDYYRYGEYPRFIRPPRRPECKAEWKRVPHAAGGTSK